VWDKAIERGKERTMIKVIAGYKVKKSEDIAPTLLKLRSNAMTYPGFVSEEILINDKSIYMVIVVSTWVKAEDWRVWEESTIRKGLLQQAKAILVDETRVTVWRVMPTVRWVG
jgi:antibiotic biosynthesis monooxygenase (ABM) superfamily enzyme